MEKLPNKKTTYVGSFFYLSCLKTKKSGFSQLSLTEKKMKIGNR